MALSLFQSLIRKPYHLISTSSSSFLRRRYSRPSTSDNSYIFEMDLGEIEAGSYGAEVDLIGGIQKLEDAIYGIVVRKSAPAWLPFIPGSSYWVPPRKNLSSNGLTELVGRVVNPMNYEEMMSLTTTRGWPASAYFLEGLPPHSAKENQEDNTVKSDEED